MILLVLFILLPAAVWAQFLIKGTVVDETGLPIIGAAIVEKDNVSNGVSTDAEGKFTLKVKSAGAKILIKYLGFEELTLTAGSIKENSPILMKEDAQMLGEIQVVNMGFGSKSRVSTVAAISQIDSKMIRQSPSSSIQNSLVGKLPGLFQLQRSGQPGNDAATLMIRGISSESNSTPLVLIDDVESTITALTQMDPNDVESVSLLKDAGSTAIFGIKGANGVILVTTRRGKEGPAKVTYRSDFGIQQPTYRRRSLSSYESLMLIREQMLNGSILSDGTLDPSYKPENSNSLLMPEVLEHYRTQDMPFVYPDVDWYSEVFKKASFQAKQTFDIQGGTKNVKYFISLGYLYQGGMLKNYADEDFNNEYYLKRYNVRSNVDINVTPTTLLKIGVNGVIDEINSPNLPDPRRTGGALPFFSRISGGTLNSWLYPVYNEDGSYGGMGGNASTNPVALLRWGGYSRNFKNNATGNASVEQKLDFITPGLKLKGLLAVTNNWAFNRSLTRNTFLEYQYDATTKVYTACTPDTYMLPKLSVESSSTVPYLKMNSQIHLNYARKFGGHNLSALVLASWDSGRSGASTPDNAKGFNGRISYDYKTKYLIELSGAYNGSDKFKAKKRYDLFPAIGLGWNVTEESFAKSFLKHYLAIDYWKIRGSAGIVGSDYFSSSFSNYYVEKYGVQSSSSDYYFGENPVKFQSIALTQLPNDNVTWEKERKIDIGTDIQLFSNQLAITFDYFFNERYDILLSRGSMPYYVGIPSKALPPINMGKNQNKGFDGEIIWRSKIGNDFKYHIKGTFSHSENKVIFRDEPLNMYPALMQTGHNIGRMVGYIWDGYYTSVTDINNSPVDMLTRNLKPGDLKYKDISGPEGKPDGVIDPYDQEDVGHNYPSVTYGLSLGFSYKDFDFSMLFQGATGGVLNSNTLLQIGNDNGVPSKIHTKRWTYFDQNNNFVTDEATLIAMNKKAEYPRLGGSNWHTSTFWLRSTDYLRLKNFEIGYNLSGKWCKSIGLSKARVFANGQNLLTWSWLNLYQVDPESNTGDRAAYESYPQQRLFNFGFQVTF